MLEFFPFQLPFRTYTNDENLKTALSEIENEIQKLIDNAENANDKSKIKQHYITEKLISYFSVNMQIDYETISIRIRDLRNRNSYSQHFIVLSIEYHRGKKRFNTAKLETPTRFFVTGKFLKYDLKKWSGASTLLSKIETLDYTLFGMDTPNYSSSNDPLNKDLHKLVKDNIQLTTQKINDGLLKEEILELLNFVQRNITYFNEESDIETKYKTESMLETDLPEIIEMLNKMEDDISIENENKFKNILNTMKSKLESSLADNKKEDTQKLESKMNFLENKYKNED